MLDGASTQKHEEDGEIRALHLDHPIQLRQLREVEAITCKKENCLEELKGPKLTCSKEESAAFTRKSQVQEGPVEIDNSAPKS
jgi:hypothetical protein